MSILEDAVETLCDTVRDELGETVRYEGDTSGVQIRLPAVPSKPEELVDAATGEVRIEAESLDWTICARDLILAGTILRPARGHKIYRANPVTHAAEVYEVLPIDGEQCFVKLDPDGRLIRVHTKRLS